MEARTMYDSTSAVDIPRTAEIVAGYVDGAYAWSATDWARFPLATKVRIATRAATDDGDVLDVELGDATPDEAPGWIRRRQAAGVIQPTVYCGRSALGLIRRVSEGLLYSLWVADWTGRPHRVGDVAAVQYANSAQSGGHYDLSIVYDPSWPGAQLPVTGGDALDLDTARAIVHPILALQGILGDQAQVDAFASRMVPPNNPEAVLTDLEMRIKADPRSLWSRVAALERKSRG